LIAALLLAATALACTGEPERREAAASPPLTRIRVISQPHGSWSPIYLAHAAGDFAAEGLEVELVPAMRSEESLVAVVTGDVDVRPGPVSAGLLSAVDRGAPIRIVAGMGVLDSAGCTYMGMVLRPGLDTVPVPTLRRIRASQDGASRYLVHEMLRQRGLALGDIETVRLPEAVLADALRTGAVDGVMTTEHALSRLARSGTRWLAAERAVPGFQWGVITFSERLWKREPELGRRFLRAYRRGITRYNAGKTDSNVAVVARATGDDPTHLRRSCWLTIPDHARIAWPTIAAYQRWARTEGLMEREVPAAAVWDSSFVVATDAAAAAFRPSLHQP
jgi:ABC-type nitrate/sulfonate/bicarbonate transport system substrate-binding protein